MPVRVVRELGLGQVRGVDRAPRPVIVVGRIERGVDVAVGVRAIREIERVDGVGVERGVLAGLRSVAEVVVVAWVVAEVEVTRVVAVNG